MKSQAKIVAPVQRAKGGKAQVVSGNKNVIDEAEEDKTGDVDNRKHGGKAMHHHRKKGGKMIGKMSGGPVRARLDRPGRKRGGGVGANASPLSTAHNASGGAEGSSNPTDTYGGTPK